MKDWKIFMNNIEKAIKQLKGEVLSLESGKVSVDKLITEKNKQIKEFLLLIDAYTENPNSTIQFKHNWNCTQSGFYDSIYRCTKCGIENMESIDSIKSNNPIYGCEK